MVALGAGLLWSGNEDLVPYLGTDHPFVLLVVVVCIGVVCLRYLDRAGRLRIWQRERRIKAVGTAFGLATAFAPVAIIIDILARFPDDLNVLPPAAFAFYPIVGFVAEVIFHLAPIALVLLVVGRGRNVESSLLIGFVIAALMEPGFQVVAGLQDGMSWSASAATFLYLLGFSSTQLWVFKRYGFLVMYAQRLIYYGYWHILWGTARLEWLF